MAECPSRSYLDLVVTSGGLTPKDPYGAWSSNWDYAEWRVLAEELIARMEEAREYLGSIEPAPYPEWERLRTQANDLRARFAELPEAWGFTEIFDVKTEVPKAVNLAVRAACLWEQHDLAAEALGGTPPARPSEVPGGRAPGALGRIPWWGWTIAGVAGVVILLGVVQIGLRELRLRRRALNPARRRRRAMRRRGRENLGL